MTPQELKNSILQRAIQGKLVEQRPEEGTGEELYKQIQAEKAKLIKEGKLKKEKPLPPISEDDIPFGIPESWKWVHVASVCSVIMGQSPEGNNVNSNGKGMEFHQGKISFTDEIIGVSGQYSTQVTKVAPANSLLLCVRAPVGKVNITNRELCIGRGLSAITVYADEPIMFFFYLFQQLESVFNKKATGTTFKAISAEIIANQLIPLPPLAEQKRIVAKIEELMPLVEQYEKAYNRLEQLNKQFPDDMKKSILQLAIQGKLVEQRADEGSGEELYKQIQAEKARLIKEGKLKKEKPLPDVSNDEIPFDIPDSWKWIRLGDVVEIARGGSPRPIKEYLTQRSDGLNWIKIGDSIKGSKYINSTAEKILPSGLHKTRLVHKGDFILSNSMSFGRPYILNIDGCIHDGWLVIHQYYPLFDKEFLFYLLSSPMVFKQFCDRVAGAVVNNLNSDKVALTLVPVIPVAEQKRIVAKIEELLPLCDLLSKKQ